MSSRIARLAQNYARHVALPWATGVSGAQKVWFAVYDKTDERRLRSRIEEFALATKAAGHGWTLVDVTNLFPTWMAAHRYRESYFKRPALLQPALKSFRDHAVATISETLTASDENTVVGLVGVGSLFGLAKVSDLVNALQPAIRGRLLVFFPGEYEHNTYRLLDARDGWNYMAVPITSQEGSLVP